MNISPVNTRLIKAANPTFCASLKRKPSLSNYLDSLSFEDRKTAEDALYLFAKNLDKRPESTVLEVDTIAPEKAESVLVGTDPEWQEPLRVYNPETEQDEDDYSNIAGKQFKPVYKTENIQLSAQGKSSGFYMNLKKTPQQLAGWLEDTYKHITGATK